MISHTIKSAQAMQDQLNGLAVQVNQLASQVAQMSRPPVLSGAFLDALTPLAENEAAQELLARPRQWAECGTVNAIETGKRIPMAFSDPEMQRAYDAGEPVFATDDQRRIEELEEELREALEQGDRRGRQASEFEERMGDLQVRNGKLERALAGMLFEFDDGVNGGHRESPDEHVAALDYARTLVKAEEFKG